LGIYLEEKNIDVCFLTESWLDDNFDSFLLSINGNYDDLRQDRMERQGGGVCALIKKGLNFVKVSRTGRET
jgi:hypothetical protein